MLPPRLSWRLALLALIAVPAGFFLVLSASYLYLGPTLPSAQQITTVQLQTPMRIYSADGSLLAEFGGKRRLPLSYEQFPPDFIHAALAAEDEDFFTHGAVDVKGLLRAAVDLVRYQEIRSGGSTITMQVARNFFLSFNQTFLRKFNEIVLAIQIEHLLPKQEILALYLNKIFLGHHAYGAAAAAEVYYGKSLAELNLAQMAMIAGLPKAPSLFNPITNPERALIRRNWILGRMRDQRLITEAQYQLAAAQPVTARYHDVATDIEAGYAAEVARRQVIDLLGEDAYTSGISVYTTIDSKRQQAAADALRQGLQEYDKRHGWRGVADHLDISDLPALPKEASDNLAVSAASRAWAGLLDRYPRIANLETALVADVDDQDAVVVLQDAREVRLGLDAMSWAQPFVDVDRRGAAPASVKKLLRAGDVIYLLPQPSQDGKPAWRLAEIPAVQGALVSLDPQTGAILAMQGGYSFGQSHFNRTMQALRQPGSSFKPFIYTSALEQGMTPATLINDAPLVFNDQESESQWRPKGDTNTFNGPTRLRVALYRSLNLASIRLLQQIGIGNAFNTFKQFHLPVSTFPRDLSISLGSVSLSPLQMATAYSTFANGGYHIQPWLIKRIAGPDNQPIWEASPVLLCDMEIQPDGSATLPADSPCPAPDKLPPASELIDSGGDLEALTHQDKPGETAPRYRYQTLDKRIVWLMYSIMQDVINRGTARRAAALGYPGLAGKTGTTNDQVDAWFNGFSPDLVASVWVGFDQPAPLGRGEQGSRAALPIWIDYMRVALPPTPERSLPEPAGITSVLIDADTGKRARPGDANSLFEYFPTELVPPLEKSTAPETNVGPQGLF